MTDCFLLFDEEKKEHISNIILPLFDQQEVILYLFCCLMNSPFSDQMIQRYQIVKLSQLFVRQWRRLEILSLLLLAPLMCDGIAA